MGAYDRDGGGGALPPDLEIDSAKAAESAASTSANSYTKTIRMSPVVGKTYKFWFTYLYEDPESKKISESENSPVFTTTFAIENQTKPVKNLTLTSGIKSYGIKFDIDPESVQSDIIVYESLTGAFSGEEYIVYVGTSTNISVQVDSFAPRWVKVVTRDNWLDANRSSVIAGPVQILTNDPDTSTPPLPPSGTQADGSIDPDDKSGFSGKLDVSWTANSDTNTAGYVIRWSTQNPATTQNPLWEYGQVEGKSTTKFTVTGLIPNTLYYYQVTAKSPYNAISWSSPASGTFGPIVDSNAPADVWAQLRSVLSIGGKTADLFKIGTGISQSINTSTTTTPSMVSSNYSGIILNKSTTNFGHNYWLNTGQFRVGSSSAFLYWDGSDLYTTGKLNATGGSFTGDVRLNGGTLYTGPTPLSGARVRFDSAGLFAYNSTSTSNSTGQTLAITAADGKIDARLGYVGGWTIEGTSQTVGSIYSSNTKLESNGTITLGDTTGTLGSIVRLSATDPNYRIWIGSQIGNNAKFKVGLDGTLYASNAVISVSSGGVYDSIVAAQNAASAASDKATEAKNDATAALTTVDGKNSIFRTGSTPSALKAGDIWINSNDGNKLYVAAYAGTGGWQLSQDTSIALAVSRADDALNKATAAVNTANNAYPASNFSKSAILQAINASTNGATLNGGVLETGTVVADNVVSTYVYAGYIDAEKINVGTLSGQRLIAGSTGTSYYLDTRGTKGGVDCLVVNGIGIESTTTGGVLTHWYPYYGGSPNIDLGTTTYRWNDARFSGSVMVGHNGSDTVGITSGPKIKLNPGGTIYANTLGTGSGNTIVQDGGYFKVQVSSLRYKENVNEIGKNGFLGIINSLRPVTYNYIGDTGDDGMPRVLSGLIAEELDAIPELRTVVNYDEEGRPDGIAYDRLTASLVLAIQDLSDMVESLQQEVHTLKGI